MTNTNTTVVTTKTVAKSNTAKDLNTQLDSLCKVREEWELGAYKTSNDQLYEILARCLDIYQQLRSDIKQRAEFKARLDDLKAKNLIVFNESTNLPTRIVRYVFRNNGKRSFAYSWQRINGITEPYVVIEEADQLSKSLQQKLRASLDETDYGHVILTTNHIHNLDEPLVDRCDDIEMPMANTDVWFDAAATILDAEGVEFTDDQLDALLASGTGSIRDMMRGLEDFVLARK